MAASIWGKVRRQTLKDYVLFPLLAGPQAPLVLAGDASANLVRNVWAFMIIFCGHFPDGTDEFSVEEAENETRGGWYLRQLLGSSNLTGGKLFHILSGNLSFQIEHHLFPDIPAHRYAEISVEVREICERYGIDYHTGPLPKQFGSVVRKIVRLALPGGPGDKRDRTAMHRGAPPSPRSPPPGARRPSRPAPRRRASARRPRPTGHVAARPDRGGRAYGTHANVNVPVDA